MVTVGSAIGATIPTTFGQTRCNVLVDTGAMKSCMSQAYYQQLMLPTTRPIQTYQVKSANGSNLCPIVITECELKIGQKEYKNDYVVCKNLMQGEMHDCIPLVLINLNEDEKIFLRKGEILGHLEPSLYRNQ